MVNKKSRSFKAKFTIEAKASGRYTGDSPYQAANKALSEIIRKKVRNGEKITGKINFTLIESTKNSKHKAHQYTGKRIKLKKPIEYKTKTGAVITKKFKNQLRKIKKCDLINFKLCEA